MDRTWLLVAVDRGWDLAIWGCVHAEQEPGNPGASFTPEITCRGWLAFFMRAKARIVTGKASRRP